MDKYKLLQFTGMSCAKKLSIEAASKLNISFTVNHKFCQSSLFLVFY